MLDGLFNPRRPPALTRVLFAAVTLAIVYLSVWPMSDWRLRQPSTFAFLTLGIPRYWSVADLSANIAAYVVFGLLMVLAWCSPARPFRAIAAATVAGFALSILLESMQSWLPTRVPSMLDVSANGGGAAIGGALGAMIGATRARLAGERRQVSLQWYQQGPALGWALLLVWVIGQIPTQRLLFTSGHVVRWVGAFVQRAFGADGGSPPGAVPDWLESLQAVHGLAETVAIMSTIGVLGVLVMDLVRPVGARLAWVGGLLLFGLALRVMLAPLVYRDQPPLVWLTAGAQAGIVLGAAMLYLIGAFRVRTRLAIGVLLVPLSILLVFVASFDPYFVSTMAQARSPLEPALTPSLRSLINLLGGLWPLLCMLYFVARLTTIRERERPKH
ncbi:MAG: VanZ family protein [Lautropia sp.]